MSAASFAELGVPDELVEVLSKQRINEPFAIQKLTIPDSLAGRDILARAPTGSGKTLAFGIPLLARLGRGTSGRPRGLILSPTRELAEQISRELSNLASAVDRSVLAIYGGTGIRAQIKAAKRGPDLLVACPGRLLDLMNQGVISLEDVDLVVVDEADRMADMGFLPDVRRLLDQTGGGGQRQVALFSATLDDDVQELIKRYLVDPVQHEIGEPEPDLRGMEHRFIKTQKQHRVWLAADLIAAAPGPVMVFARTRHGVDRLARQLRQEGITTGHLHGGRSQSQRDRALKVFSGGTVDALVATDVAARGIHVDGVACVIHFDPPADSKDYVHRSGRTARAGAGGVVVSLLEAGQIKATSAMKRRLGIDAEIEPTPERQPRSSRPDAIITSADTRRGSQRSNRSAKSGKPGGSGDSSGRSRNGTKRSGGKKSADSRSSSAKRNGEDRSTGRPSRNGGKSASGTTSSTAKSSGESRSSEATPRRSDSGSSSRSGSPASRSGETSGQGTRRSTKKAAGKRAGANKGAGKRKNASGKRVGASSTGRNGASGSQAGAGSSTGGKSTSSRSGKPRPKNRKNKPGGARRRP